MCLRVQKCRDLCYVATASTEPPEFRSIEASVPVVLAHSEITDSLSEVTVLQPSKLVKLKDSNDMNVMVA